MQISTLLNHALPSLKPSDTVAKALDWLQEYGLGQLAIVEDGQYKGMAEIALIEHFDDDKLLSEIPASNPDLVYLENQDILDILPCFFNKNASIDALAIKNKDEQFVGILLKKDVLETFVLQQNWQDIGAVIVLQFGMERDYSLSEVSRLIESNHVKVLSSFVQTQEQAYLVTLKLNTSDISSTIATLERYGYAIAGTFSHKPIERVEQDRFDNLMRYLNV